MSIKKFLLFNLFFFSPMFSMITFAGQQDRIFIYRNTSLLKLRVPLTEKYVLPLDNNEYVVFVEKADYYKIEKSTLDDLEFNLIGTNEMFAKRFDMANTKILSKKPPILKISNKIYYFDINTGFWYEADEKNLDILLNSKKLVAKNIEGDILITKPLEWDLFYDLKSNGDLYLTYLIRGKTNKSVDALLIDGELDFDVEEPLEDVYQDVIVNYSKSMEQLPERKYTPEIISETAVIDIGEIQPFNGNFEKVIKVGTIKEMKDIPTLNLHFYTSSFENRFLEIYRVFENSKENGVGVPLISGDVRIYENKNNEEFLRQTTNLPKTNVGEICKIDLGQGWSVSADLNITHSYKSETYISRSFEINLTNDDDKEKEILISFYTYETSIDLLKYETDLEVTEKKIFKDRIEFYLKIKDSGVLNISLRSNK